MTDPEVSEWAAEFWRRIGHLQPFPRSLESVVGWAFPLAILKLPRLTLDGLRSWLNQRRIAFLCDDTDRRLRAALVARGGHGLVFLEATDPLDEQRLSVAHEVVHFVRHYLEPRERAIALLGEVGLEILDGRRPPTLEERLRGLLSHVELGTMTHLMERSKTRDIYRTEVMELEDEADRLALELLAPLGSVIGKLDRDGISWHSPGAGSQAAEVLLSEFGLPPSAAGFYARLLIGRQRANRSFRDWIGA